jgi:Helix-turn-helix domain
VPETHRQRRQPPRRKPNPLHRGEYKLFRELLLQWRTDAKLSQRALAERLGRSLAWVNRCETGGRRMDALEWLDWMDACGVDVLKAARALRR